uniref:Uncharacterized protein n=1 Tax=Anopheles melas TaxID=34690 RepID=A0A182UKM9_9DIPT
MWMLIGRSRSSSSDGELRCGSSPQVAAAPGGCPLAELLTEVEVVVYGVPVGVSFVADEVVVLAPVKLFHSNVKLLDRLPSSEFRWSKLRFRNRLGDSRPGDESEPIPDELTTPGPVGSSASPSVIPCREPPSKDLVRKSQPIVVLVVVQHSAAAGRIGRIHQQAHLSTQHPTVARPLCTWTGRRCPGTGREHVLPILIGVATAWSATGSLFALAPLGPPVLEPDLDARLGKIDAHRQLLAKEHVRVVRPLEGTLELLQLERVERRPGRRIEEGCGLVWKGVLFGNAHCFERRCFRFITANQKNPWGVSYGIQTALRPAGVMSGDRFWPVRSVASDRTVSLAAVHRFFDSQLCLVGGDGGGAGGVHCHHLPQESIDLISPTFPGVVGRET